MGLPRSVALTLPLREREASVDPVGVTEGEWVEEGLPPRRLPLPQALGVSVTVLVGETLWQALPVPL